MTNDHLAAIEAREQKATPGPWLHDRYNEEYAEGCTETHWVSGPDGADGAPTVAHVYTDSCTACWPNIPNDDAEFIAHAREDIPALVAEVRAMKSEISDLQRHMRNAL